MVTQERMDEIYELARKAYTEMGFKPHTGGWVNESCDSVCFVAAAAVGAGLPVKRCPQGSYDIIRTLRCESNGGFISGCFNGFENQMDEYYFRNENVDYIQGYRLGQKARKEFLLKQGGE